MKTFHKWLRENNLGYDTAGMAMPQHNAIDAPADTPADDQAGAQNFQAMMPQMKQLLARVSPFDKEAVLNQIMALSPQEFQQWQQQVISSPDPMQSLTRGRGQGVNNNQGYPESHRR